MSEERLIILLKVAMVIGICLILSGHYLLSYTDIQETLGPTGFIIGAGCIAFGLICSLPTKMYLTFILMKRENEQNEQSGQD